MERFSVLLALCGGNSPATDEFPSQRPVTRSFDAFFDLRLNKPLSKQSRRWWFETSSCSLWRNRNEISLSYVSCIQYCIPLRFLVHLNIYSCQGLRVNKNVIANRDQPPIKITIHHLKFAFDSDKLLYVKRDYRNVACIRNGCNQTYPTIMLRTTFQ